MSVIELDNIELIKGILNFPDKDTYYYLQVLERKKEYTRQRYSSPITSFQTLEKLLPNVKDICQKFEARAYISLLPRSIEKYTKELSIAVIERIKHGNYVSSNFRLTDSVALHPETIKKGGNLWLFDVDSKDYLETVKDWCNTNNIIIKTIIPTFSGYHFIVQPFNPSSLGIPGTMIVRVNDIKFDIKKDSNTIIYGIS
jgi:hypothetical protein